MVLTNVLLRPTSSEKSEFFCRLKSILSPRYAQEYSKEPKILKLFHKQQSLVILNKKVSYFNSSFFIKIQNFILKNS